MLALKERNDKDTAQQDVEMKELQRIIKHDNRLKEFMGIKVNDRAELKEEERIKRSKGKGKGQIMSMISRQFQRGYQIQKPDRLKGFMGISVNNFCQA